MSSQKRKYRVRLEIWLVLFLGVIAITALIDSPRYDDSHLKSSFSDELVGNPVPELRSSYPERTFQSMALEDEFKAMFSQRDAEPVDLETVDKMANQYLEQKYIFTKASEMQNWQIDPRLLELSRVQIPNGWVSVACTIWAEAFLKIQSGDTEQAIEDGVTVLHFGLQATRAKGTSGSYQAGLSIYKIGLGILEQCAADSSVSNRELAQISSVIQHSRLHREFLQDSLRSDNHVIRNFLEKETSSRNRVLTQLFFKQNRTQRMFGELTSGIITDVENFPQHQRLNPDEMDEKFRALSRRKLSLNRIGENAFGSFGPFLFISPSKFFVLQYDVEVLLTRVSLKRFQNDTGEWPSGLNQLVPSYLDSEPINPLNGEPFLRVADTLLICGLPEQEWPEREYHSKENIYTESAQLRAILVY